MKLYSTSGGMRWSVYPKIIEVEVERQSEKCVWINGRRNLKVSEYMRYHETWEDAWSFLMKAARRKVDSARGNLERAEKNLKAIEDLKK